uniref:Uncharacterized protein n=1 Tax=Arundo donax TaxID=35708 RepID=A0A0A9ACZ1_ARUDO
MQKSFLKYNKREKLMYPQEKKYLNFFIKCLC